jgi:Xaa-Pro dipeptidase
MEPLVYRSGHGFGMQIKDMVAIGDGGARLLSDVTEADLYRIEA